MSRRVLLVAVPALLLVAAGWVLLRPPSTPAESGDCRWVLGDGPKKDCMVQVALGKLAADPAAGFAFTEAEIEPQLQRDYVYLQYVQTIDARSQDPCKRIENARFKELCLERVKRPHLSRGTAPSK